MNLISAERPAWPACHGMVKENCVKPNKTGSRVEHSYFMTKPEPLLLVYGSKPQAKYDTFMCAVGRRPNCLSDKSLHKKQQTVSFI